MKRLIAVVGAIVLAVAVLTASPIYLAETGWGTLSFDTNELSILSKLEDPPKLRLGAGQGVGSGAISFNRIIDGVQRENVLFQGKQDERVRANPRNVAGEFTLHVNDGSSTDDAAMVQVLEVRHDTFRALGVTFTKADLEALKKLAAK